MLNQVGSEGLHPIDQVNTLLIMLNYIVGEYLGVKLMV